MNKTISLIESYYSIPSRDSFELYRRIFKTKDKELQNLFTEKSYLCLLRIQVESENDQYDFDLNDLEYTFSIFGKIDKIILKPKCVAFIQYQEFLEAFFAQRSLNDLKINETNCHLKVQICCVVSSTSSLKEDVTSQFINNDADIDQSFQYFTKFLIDINDPNFNVIDRVLGQRACNLLRIQFMVSKQIEGAEQMNDLVIKIGQKQQYFVIVYGQSYEKFNNACKLIHELIANIYEEYKRFCEFRNIPFPNDLRLKKEEKYQNESQLIFLNK